MELVCWKCGRTYKYSPGLYRCISCGEYLLVKHELKTRELSDVNTLVDVELKKVSLGEGRTPIIRFDDVYLKLENLNPTGSFKDRGAASAVSEALLRQCSTIVEDSSGNAGISFSAYAGYVGLKAKIYVPADAPLGKRRLIKALGATVVEAPTRDEAAKLAVNDSEGCYVGHRVNPYFLEGVKDLALELVKEFKHVDCIVSPLASGTLVIGLWKGYTELLKAGLIKDMPKIVAVQACGYDSLRKYVEPHYSICRSRAVLPDGIRLTDAPRLEHVASILRETGGYYIVLDDDFVKPYIKELWNRGVLAEPTSAYGYAAAKLLIKEKLVDGVIVVPITGNGVKHVVGGLET